MQGGEHRNPTLQDGLHILPTCLKIKRIESMKIGWRVQQHIIIFMSCFCG